MADNDWMLCNHEPPKLRDDRPSELLRLILTITPGSENKGPALAEFFQPFRTRFR